MKRGLLPTGRVLAIAVAGALAVGGALVPSPAGANTGQPIWDCPDYGQDPYIPPATYVPVFCAQPRVGKDTDVFMGLLTAEELRYRTSSETEWLVDGVTVARGVGVYAPRPADVGKPLRLRTHLIGVKDGQPWRVVKESVEVRIDPGEFVQASTPTVSGTADVGTRITALPGVWAPAPGTTLAYQWLSDGEPIPGATTHEYTPVEADRATAVSVRVTGTRPGYRPTSRISIAQRIPSAQYTAALTPTIEVAGGSLKAGVSARAVTGRWVPEAESFAYQWLRDGEPIPDATTERYTPVAADVGSDLSVQVFGTRKGYITTDRTSDPTRVGPADPPAQAKPKQFTAAPKPKISGSMRLGKKLTAKPGVWKPGTVKLKYQWLRNGKKITGATKSKYKLTRKDRGKRISVRVTASQKGYVTVTKTSTGKRLPYAR